MIEARIGWQDDRVHPRQRQHVFQVQGGKRRFAGDEDELALFFQHHVGGAFDQVVGQAVGDGGERAHRAGADHHRIGGIGTGCDRCIPVLAAEHAELASARIEAFRQLPFEVASTCRQHHAEFLFGDDVRGLRYQQINLQVGSQQALKETQAVGHAGGA